MANTVSWTEPLSSTGERLYLGFECDCGCGEERGVACMGGAGCCRCAEGDARTMAEGSTGPARAPSRDFAIRPAHSSAQGIARNAPDQIDRLAGHGPGRHCKPQFVAAEPSVGDRHAAVSGETHDPGYVLVLLFERERN